MSELKAYFEANLPWLEVVEAKTEAGGIDYYLKIDGTYSEGGADGMLEYHRNELKRVLKAEGLL